MPYCVHFVIIHDPDEIGGFATGAKFDAEDMEQMLVHHSFTVGTLIKATNWWRRGKYSYPKGIYEYNRKHQLVRAQIGG